MKKMISVLAVALAMVSFSASSFAAMKLVGEIEKLPPVSQMPYVDAKLYNVDYLYQDGKPFVFIHLLSGDNSNYANLDILFTDADAAYGMQFAGAVGKQVTIYFVKKSNFEIEQLDIHEKYGNSTADSHARQLTLPH